MLISDIQTTNMYALVVFKSDEYFYELKNWFSRKKKNLTTSKTQHPDR